MQDEKNVTPEQAINDALKDGFQSMTNGERSVTNIPIRDLLALKHDQDKDAAAQSGNVFGKVSIKNNSARF